MPNKTDVKNPTTMSDYDWLEFVGFTWKVENEGYEYAAENCSPKFETEELKAAAGSTSGLRALYQEHVAKVEPWADALGYKEVDRVWTAHLQEQKERREAHLLWAVHPGGDWDCAAYSDAFATREDVDRWIDQQQELVEKYGWKPWQGRILHREVPGGEWTEVR